jgi:hypothetical protein
MICCDICEQFEERAAIMQHMGGQSKRAAETGAATCVRAAHGVEAIAHLRAVGLIKEQQQTALFDSARRMGR